MSDPLRKALAAAVRVALRRPDKVRRICCAIANAAWDANTTGRITPARNGMTTAQAIDVAQRYTATAIATLRKRP